MNKALNKETAHTADYRLPIRRRHLFGVLATQWDSNAHRDPVGVIILLDLNSWLVRPSGLAYLGAICGKQSLSVIEDTGFESWRTASHELGHR